MFVEIGGYTASMDSKAATLMIRFKTANRTWKRANVAHSANGRIRSGYALLDSEVVKVPAGFYYEVRFWKDGYTRYENAGKNASDAEARRQVLQRQMGVKAAASEVNLVIVEGPERKTVDLTAGAYIKLKDDVHASEAASQARLVTKEFQECTRKRYIDEITTADITRFHEALRKRKCSPRTVANKHARLRSWLLYAGVDKSIFPPKPRYEQELPTIYERDHISSLLGAGDGYMHLAINMGLKLGLRDQELQHAAFSDINKSEKTFRVQGKPKWGFTVKTYEQRDIPIRNDLLQELEQWKKLHPKQELILATKKGNPNRKLLRMLKRLAKAAELNCGHCDGCKSRNRECQEFELHKLRRTFITGALRAGFDLRTVQAWAGHKDIESTMRYLRPAAAKDIQEKLNNMEW
jgi:integrase